MSISGVYPHLAMANSSPECGTGAVVPWQGSLWVVTYAPHMPKGSDDKLYEVTPDLRQVIFPGSVGGTPANRMIHRETQQLLIGPYLVAADKSIRVIPPSKMFGRLTANARHLEDPAGKAYYATMEEGLYEVDLSTLDVTTLIRDTRAPKSFGGQKADLPGYHGKGLASGHGRVVYANNGEKSAAAKADPTTPSGALAEFRTGDANWTLVRRNQFTEVTGPGGLNGSEPGDPIWAMGWDAKSLLLGVLDDGPDGDASWSYFRLPKGSHSYDGAHGWNTEWPRIRSIAQPNEDGPTDNLLATMHGTLWSFPAAFSPTQTAGIRPRSNYLKVVGDFCGWDGRVVFGCDDSASSEFLNKRDFKAEGAAPGQSNSNLWFVDSDRLDDIGPVIGRGAIWRLEDVAAEQPSDPYLWSGYDHTTLCLSHESPEAARFRLEVDRSGDGNYEEERTLVVPAGESMFHERSDRGQWLRIVPLQDTAAASAFVLSRDEDPRSAGAASDPMFAGLVPIGEPVASRGLMRSQSAEQLVLTTADEQYELGRDLTLQPLASVDADRNTFIEKVAQPARSFRRDAAAIIVEEDGRRFRLPVDNRYAGDDATPYDRRRVCREVATERDLLNLDGTFYELPARNAGGLAKMRPIATHGLDIHDYCSHNGLLFLTGLDATSDGPNIRRSGEAAVWAGVVDDLWKLGKPGGRGGWADVTLAAGEATDPFLFTGYDRKSIAVSGDAGPVAIELDVDGTAQWKRYTTLTLPDDGEQATFAFPRGLEAYWVRLKSPSGGTYSATLTYE